MIEVQRLRAASSTLRRSSGQALLRASVGEQEATAVRPVLSPALSRSSERSQEVAEGTVARGMRVENLSAGFGDFTAIRHINLKIKPNKITAIIGPSGSGKSTLIRCLNRMHEEVRGAWVRGQVRLGEEDIYAPSADPVRVRRRVGMVFQKPNPFPTMSVFDNVAAGLKTISRGGLDSEA